MEQKRDIISPNESFGSWEKGMCPLEDSILAFLAPCSRNKGRVRKEGARPSNQGFPVTGTVETVVLIWAKERAARKWKLGFAIASWLR